MGRPGRAGIRLRPKRSFHSTGERYVTTPIFRANLIPLIGGFSFG